jgi:predicted LPLAT superfamily acyltransferase
MLDAEHVKIKDYLDSVTRRKFNVIAIKEDNSHIYEINKAFHEKQMVCIHGDRFVKGSKTISVEFLGERANFPTGPFYLAMKFNVPVSCFCMKDSARIIILCFLPSLSTARLAAEKRPDHSNYNKRLYLRSGTYYLEVSLTVVQLLQFLGSR